MDHKFTKEIGEWLESAGHDITVGARLLLQLTGNRMQYAAICLNPAKYAEMVEYQLQKHYNYRVADLTLQELKTMKSDVDAKSKVIGISADPDSATEAAASFSGYGKRPDHELLPAAIRQKYVDNLEIRRKMQQLHLQIRTKYATIDNCSASDVYALVTELLRYEKAYNDNWADYDAARPIEEIPAE